MPLPRPPAFLADCTLAVLVLALAEAEFAAGEITGPIWLGVAGGIALSVPLLWVRRQPWPMLIAVFAVIVATRLLGLEQHNFLDEQVAGTVAVYAWPVRSRCGKRWPDWLTGWRWSPCQRSSWGCSTTAGRGCSWWPPSWPPGRCKAGAS